MMSSRFPALMLAGLTGLVASCLSSPAQARWGWKQEAPAASSMPATCNNQDFLNKQQDYENGGAKGDTPVHICGTVRAVSAKARHTRSGWHGYFYVTVAPNISIRIVTNLDEMHTPSWPWVNKGDQVEVVGRYYYDSYRKQGIDWTHRGTGKSWPIPGSVTVNGTKYD